MSAIAVMPWSPKPWATSAKHAIIDLGPLGPESIRRAEHLFTLAARPAWCARVLGRLYMRISLPKLPTFLEASAPIAAGGTYWLSTHHWLGLSDGETVVEAVCPDYEAETAARQEEDRRSTGFYLFGTLERCPNMWGKYKLLARALGGIRAYGKRTPITPVQVLDVFGWSNEFCWFLQSVPTWQDQDLVRICQHVLDEAAERARPIAETDPGPEPSNLLVEALASARDVIAATQGKLGTLGNRTRGEEVAFPLRRGSLSAAKAMGYASILAAGSAPEFKRDPSGSPTGWYAELRVHPAYVSAAAHEMKLQADRFIELCRYPG